MQQKDQVKKIAAGMFLFFCITVIVVMIFTIGLEKGFVEPKISMTVLFRKVGGLSIGAPVRLSGVTVGTVKEIDFLEKEISDRGVKVELSLYKKYQAQLRKSSRVAIVTEGVLGEKIVDISADSRISRDDLSAQIIGEDPLEVGDLAQTFNDTAEALFDTAVAIGAMVENLDELNHSTQRLLNRIEQRVIDGNLFKVF